MGKIIVLLLFSLVSYSQPEFNNWVFGERAGLNFGMGNPIATGPHSIVTQEGVASISDNTGMLLFYTDGIRVWDRLGGVMPNGTGLLGNNSTTQSGVILQQISNPGRYYIFTAPETGTNNPLCYSIVDMSLNFGLGDVTAKNVPLYTPSCEKIAVVRHCNNRDAWLISHDGGTNAYRVFPITSAGIGMPVISNVGIVVNTTNLANRIGYLKASPFGNKLSVCHYGMNVAVLVDFDNSTGIVSNEQIISPTSLVGPYGTEFSPNGRYVYITYNNGARLRQVDVCNLSFTDVATNLGNFWGAAQLGNDGRIYLARLNSSSLSRLNNPDNFGIASNLVINSTPLLSGTLSRFGLPNFAQYYSTTYPESFLSSVNCEVAEFTLPTVSNTCVFNYNLQSVEWSFGDGNISYSQNPTHVYSADGLYSVRLVMEFPCYRDTIYGSVNIDAGLTPQPIYTNQ